MVTEREPPNVSGVRVPWTTLAVLLQPDGRRVERQRLVAEDVGEADPHRVAPQVGLDDGANGLGLRPGGVRVGEGKGEVGLDVGSGEPGGGWRQRLVLWQRRDVHEIGRRRGGPAGHPILAALVVVVIASGAGGRNDAQAKGEQRRSGPEEATAGGLEREEVCSHHMSLSWGSW